MGLMEGNIHSVKAVRRQSRRAREQKKQKTAQKRTLQRKGFAKKVSDLDERQSPLPRSAPGQICQKKKKDEITDSGGIKATKKKHKSRPFGKPSCQGGESDARKRTAVVRNSVQVAYGEKEKVGGEKKGKKTRPSKNRGGRKVRGADAKN